MEFRPAAPEKWRVSFRVFLGPPASRRPKAPAGARVSPRNKLRFRSAWPLAERYEALLRAFNDPALCARRLARRLHKLPHRFYAALHAPPEAHDRIERFDDLGAEACIAWRPHFSSA
jgi:hypothetical protein